MSLHGSGIVELSLYTLNNALVLLLSKKAVERKMLIFSGRFFLVGAICAVSFSVGAEPAPAQSDIDKRLSRMERLLNNQNLIQMYTTQQTLKQELSGLRGDVDILNHELDQIKKQQKDLYLDIDQRLQDLQKNISSLQSIPPVSGFSGVSPSASAAPAVSAPLVTDAATEIMQNSLTEQESYQGALGLLKAGQYNDAIQAFQVFLISYPQSTYAANAQYWMAEAYYVLKDYQSAVSHFSKVITAYPDSRKVADAHLKTGFSFYELKDWTNAKKALEKVVSDYSASTAARLAQRRLQKMQLEGHI